MFAADFAIRVDATEPVWEARAEWPEVERWIGADVTSALRAGVPVLRDVHAVDHGPYLRPLGHRRAFYIRDADGVLAIKGSEPLAANFADFIAELAAERVHVELRLGTPAVDRTLARADLDGLAKLAIVEGKVPGCVTVREALDEARAALAAQCAYVARHGRPARLPLPVFVGRWRDDVVAGVRDVLAARLTPRVEAALAGGIAVYAYRYPSVPVRLAHVALRDATSAREMHDRLAEIARHVDPRRALEGWLALTAQLLALGFVAKSPETVVTGDALQVQNLCLDGGFVDASSLIETRTLDERALRDAIRRTAHELALAATRLLLGLATSTELLRDRLPELVAIVWADLLARIDAPVDPRVLDVLAARPDAYGALVRTLELAF
jgi:hypothetical protein